MSQKSFQGPRHVLFFIHIPKTAGTSLRLSLEAGLKERLILIYEDQDGRTMADALGRKHSEDAVVYGHFGSWMHHHFKVPPRYATVLRHPVERVKSWYNYQASRPQLPFYETTQRMSLAEIVRAGMTEQLNNHMTAIIAGQEVSGPNDRRTLRQAKARLKRFEFVSTVEDLADDMPRLEETVGAKLGTLANANVTGHEAPRASEDESSIAYHNNLDMELYAFAKRLRGDGMRSRMCRLRWPFEAAF